MPERRRKVRVAIQKNVQKKQRRGAWRQELVRNEAGDDGLPSAERVQAKGAISRRRTIVEQSSLDGEAAADTTQGPQLAVDEGACRRGRVVSVMGPACRVEDEGGRIHECVVRGLLRRLARASRTPVAAGDRVLFRWTSAGEGCIERIETRSGVLSRLSRGREHILVANVDQLLIVGSVGQPTLKPSLVDRYLVSAAKGGIPAVVCVNKVDLVEAGSLDDFVSLYEELGYPVVLTSAATGTGIDELRAILKDRETVLSGQSGVGKSSLLNAVQPGLELAVGLVAVDSLKGRHTTTTARLMRLDFGGWVVDTPGIRQFGLWDVIPEELEGYFVEFPPFVELCKYPDCTHTHEDGCAVKQAVEDGDIWQSRYDSYVRIFHDQPMD